MFGFLQILQGLVLYIFQTFPNSLCNIIDYFF